MGHAREGIKHLCHVIRACLLYGNIIYLLDSENERDCFILKVSNNIPSPTHPPNYAMHRKPAI